MKTSLHQNEEVLFNDIIPFIDHLRRTALFLKYFTYGKLCSENTGTWYLYITSDVIERWPFDKIFVCIHLYDGVNLKRCTMSIHIMEYEIILTVFKDICG